MEHGAWSKEHGGRNNELTMLKLFGKDAKKNRDQMSEIRFH
jgi:hypothetical protein